MPAGSGGDQVELPLTAARREARAVLTPFMEARDPAEAARLTMALRPEPEDYARVFRGEAAETARRGYEAVWASGPPGPPVPGPARTELRVHALVASTLLDEEATRVHFPGGYRRIADQLVPVRIWVVWEYLEPGRSHGMRYDGLVRVGDARWAWFPKPWRILDGGGTR
ncbi:MAG: hypothetical protein ACQEXJ_12605 [Myxococcota bacterium]